jgi:hypothetical protein
MKSFGPKDGSGEPPAPGRNGERNFHGEKRSNETLASTSDPDARLYRKGPGQPAKLAYLGHVLMENRYALVVDTRLVLATGTAEREAALEMVAARPGNHRITLAADKAYNVAGFVADLRQYNVTPHVAQNTTYRRSAIDARTTRHPGYAVSGRVRKPIEEVFWLEQGDRRLSQDPLLWPRPRQLDVHVDDHCLQPRALAQADGRRGLTKPGFCPEIIFTHKRGSKKPLQSVLLQSKRVIIPVARPNTVRKPSFSAAC